jgi:2-polyprenyl-3-methyl-5-hydroxy-6-metoxy-1,4-benzoquinol methylase
MSLTDKLPDGFEQSPCELCGHDERVLVAKHTDLFLGGQTVFSMQRCLHCGAIYQHPRPSYAKMAEYYPSDYVAYTPGLHKESRLARFFREYGLKKRWRLIERYVGNGRLLDVGSATGDFLSVMRSQPNWKLVGIEPIHSAVVRSRNEVGVDVVEGLLNDVPFSHESFDVITMWDVIEHVYDPVAVIKQAANLLRPGGILVINQPNLGSIDRRLFGTAWAGYDLPRHLYLFPADLLRSTMEKVGLEEIERKCLYGSHGAAGTSVTFAVVKWLGHGRFSQTVRKLLLSKIMRLLFAPYFMVIDHFKLGSNVTTVFQKKYE